MSDDDYAKWQCLQSDAADAMSRVDEGRGTENSAGWELLAKRAVPAQSLANNFAMTLLYAKDGTRLAINSARHK